MEQTGDRIIPISDVLFEAILEERQKYEKNRKRRISDKKEITEDYLKILEPFIDDAVAELLGL